MRRAINIGGEGEIQAASLRIMNGMIAGRGTVLADACLPNGRKAINRHNRAFADGYGFVELVSNGLFRAEKQFLRGWILKLRIDKY